MSKCNDYFELTSLVTVSRINFLTNYSPEIVKRKKKLNIVTKC
jgi:hypothetical protein